MKILYINSNRYDYLQDIVYSGLVKTLGAKNVHPYPFNRSYFFNLKRYPKNLGYNEGNFFSYLKNSLSNFRYDCVIVSATKKLPFDLYNEILPQTPSSCPVAFIDGGDVADIGGDLTRIGYPELYKETISKRPFDIIFKREMLKGVEYDTNVFPCPFAFNMDRIQNLKDIKEKIYDVSFWASETHDTRKNAFSILEDKYDCNDNGTSKGQTHKSYKRRGDFYFEELKRCKITINIQGNGWDTLRFWEVPALSTFMLSQKLDIVIPNDFTDGENIALFSKDLSDMLEKIDYYLENESERENIANKSFQHLTKFHTDIARAKYIIEKIKTII